MEGPMSAKELKKRNQEIEKMLRNEKKRMQQEVVLLMLGSGQSGKSTFCKQMKILHLFGFNDQEKENYKLVVHTNIIDATLDLFEAAERHSLTFADSANQDLHDSYRLRGEVATEEVVIADMHVKVYTLDQSLGSDIKAIWSDDSVETIIDTAKELIITSSIRHYLKKIDTIASDKYVPDEVDILLARLRTTAVSETTFNHDGGKFRIVDVGGQRGERSKWLPFFSDVTAIVFLVAIYDYDTVLEEDPTVNRMHDSLELFKTIVNHTNLRNTPIILFFNKKDLFEEKIKRVDLSVCFPQYKVVNEEERSADISVSETQATNTSNITTVWKAVKRIFIQGVITEF